MVDPVTSDVEQRFESDEELIRFQAALQRLLGGTILTPAFVLDSAWFSSIRLSSIGEACLAEALRSPRAAEVTSGELIFASFLMESFDLVEMQFDASEISAALQSNMNESTLLFPNNVGRSFHDECLKWFPSRSFQLENSEAVQVLAQLDQGVYQVGDVLVGPLGVFRANSKRNLIPATDVPAFMCQDLQCFDIHRLRLHTHSEAGINIALRLVSNTVNDLGVRPDQRKMTIILEQMRMSQKKSAALFDLLVDGLSENELSTLLGFLYETQDSSERSRLRDMVSLSNKSFDDALIDLGVAAKIQCVLTFHDEEVLAALDTLTMNRTLILGQAEVRAPRVIGRWRGSLRPRLELSHLGTRQFRPTTTVALRLMELVHTNYFGIGPGSPSDLAFHLDMQGVSDSDMLLNAAIRLGDASSVLERVLLADQRVATAVAQQVGIANPQSMRRSELSQAILWKLGGDVAFQFDGVQQLVKHVDSLEDAVRSHASESDIRGGIANLFKVLEDSLRRALIFTTWALSIDHERESDGFEFDPDMGSQVLAVIENKTVTQESYRLAPGGRNSFSGLAAGFSRLAETLETLAEVPHSQSIGESHSPVTNESDNRESKVTWQSGQSRPIVFLKGPAILSISPNAQQEISSVLREMSALLGKAEVAKVRNTIIHGDNEFPSNSEIRDALTDVRMWAELSMSSGVFPSTSRLIQRIQDHLGRSECVYESPAGTQRILLPTWHNTGRMPLDVNTLIFMPIANLGTGGILRFRLRQSGNDEHWLGYPHRVSDEDANLE